MAISESPRTVISAIALSLLTAACAGPGVSGAGNVGVATPRLLPTLTGESIDLARVVRDHDATVLVFWSTECPCVRRYQDRTQALADTNDPQRVAVLLVASNAAEDEAHMREVAADRGVKLPILRDATGELAAELGAKTTPTTVVLRRDGSVAFRGWIDNERLPDDADREPYVERVLAGLLTGTSDFAARSPTYGCMITRSLSTPAAVAAPFAPPFTEETEATQTCTTCGCGAKHE